MLRIGPPPAELFDEFKVLRIVLPPAKLLSEYSVYLPAKSLWVFVIYKKERTRYGFAHMFAKSIGFVKKWSEITVGLMVA